VKHPRLYAILSIILSLFIALSVSLIKPFKVYFPHLNYLSGAGKPTSYLILLGNDSEMRANGGFAGSYAKLIANYPKFDLSFQDIYVPNGQLKGYVTPPAPIQEAFQNGSWELANADWEPDFPTSATSIRWFFEKGNEINPDNLIIMNLTTIKKVLDVVGSFTVPEYEAKITPDNLYLFLQGKVEVGFFPGSTQKKDTLTAVGLALKKEIFRLPLSKKIKIAQILYQNLLDQNIVINSKNERFQNLLQAQNFAGKLTSSTADTYLLVETNLGANKANAYVKRETNHTVSFSGDKTSHKVSVKFQNSSSEANPNPPFHYGGDYITYLRFYLPENAQAIKFDQSNITPITTKKFGLTELGFWQTTPAQNQSTISLSYTLPISQTDYSLTILKQHGLVSSPQTVTIGDNTIKTELNNDFFLSL